MYNSLGDTLSNHSLSPWANVQVEGPLYQVWVYMVRLLLILVCLSAVLADGMRFTASMIITSGMSYAEIKIGEETALPETFEGIMTLLLSVGRRDYDTVTKGTLNHNNVPELA